MRWNGDSVGWFGGSSLKKDEWRVVIGWRWEGVEGRSLERG